MTHRNDEIDAGTGMAKAGYSHVNIDDCWQLTERSLPWDDPNARQVANPERFPNGMKALADYIHGKGLKFGVHYIWDIWRCDFIFFFGKGVVETTNSSGRCTYKLSHLC